MIAIAVAARGLAPLDRCACAVKLAAATALERGADLLETPARGPDALRAALAELHAALDAAGAQRDRRSAAGPAPAEPHGERRAARRRVHHLARPELPRAGAELRGLAGRDATSS